MQFLQFSNNGNNYKTFCKPNINFEKIGMKKIYLKALFNYPVLFASKIAFLFNDITINHVKQPFYNFGSACGVGIIMIGIFRLVSLTKQRTNTLKQQSEYRFIVLDDEKILYKTLNSEMKLD